MKYAFLKLSILLIFSIISLPLLSVSSKSQYHGYTSLDADEPITFDGAKVTWKGKSFTLDEHTIFLDYRLEDTQIADNPHAFNSIKDAAAALKNGTENKPMMLLTSPGVYWVDDPDDPDIRVPKPGEYFPTGMKISCNHLYFYGLNSNPDNVVFAVNRGQTQGASGNFTMFHIDGKGLKSENVTFGNFCNVDLEFPLDPGLSREKRAEAIAQAQLFIYRSRDGVAINSNFISRLNLLPFAMVYLNCHLESSGHASFFNSVYIGCSLELYNVNFAAGRFFNCDIYLTPFTSNYKDKESYKFGFVDGRGNGLACVDTRFHRSKDLVEAGIPAEISWDRIPQTRTTRSYQHKVSLDGNPYIIQEYTTPGASVDIPGNTDLLNAYKVIYKDKVYYNVPNMLSGFDPFSYTDVIKAAAAENGKPENYYLSIPTTASLRLDSESIPIIRSTQTETLLNYGVMPADYAGSAALGEWSFGTKNPDNSEYISITDNKNGTLTVAGANHSREAVELILVAGNTLGIEAAIELTIEPPYLDAPEFDRRPLITNPGNGRVELDYSLDLDGMGDESLITWYRCKDSEGGDPMKVSVSRLNNPETAYNLSAGDVGYYLMAVIQPKHRRSDPGEPATAHSGFKIESKDIRVNKIETDFHNLPADPQPLVLPGTWTLDGYFASECYDDETEPPKPRYKPDPDSWKFSSGHNGAEGYVGLEQSKRGARLFYTPAGSNSGNMTVKALFAPKKTSGAGFGSATDQFLDVFIKFDLDSMSGYALRIERLNTLEINELGYNGDGAVAGCAFSLIRYDQGISTLLTEKLMSSAFITESLVELKVIEDRLYASVTSTREHRSGDRYNYPREVHLNTEIEENHLGGTGMLFTGTTGSNSVLVLHWYTDWE